MHTYNFCLSKGFYLRYTFCILSIYLSERVYFMSKMAQSNMHKTNLKLTVDSCSQRWSNLLSLLCFLTANGVAIKIAVFIWWRVNDRRNSNKVTWSDSIFFRLPATWECFIGKIYHAVSCPQIFPAIGRKIVWFLMELSLNPKSRTLGLSFLAPIALCWQK